MSLAWLNTLSITFEVVSFVLGIPSLIGTDDLKVIKDFFKSKFELLKIRDFSSIINNYYALFASAASLLLILIIAFHYWYSWPFLRSLVVVFDLFIPILFILDLLFFPKRVDEFRRYKYFIYSVLILPLLLLAFECILDEILNFLIKILEKDDSKLMLILAGFFFAISKLIAYKVIWTEVK